MGEPREVEYAAVTLATKAIADGLREVPDPPYMINDTPTVIRVLSADLWVRGKMLGKPTAEPARLRTLPNMSTVRVNGVPFHLSWIRFIEAAHGPLLWGMSEKTLIAASGYRGRYIAGFKRGKCVGMVAQLGGEENPGRAKKGKRAGRKAKAAT